MKNKKYKIYAKKFSLARPKVNFSVSNYDALNPKQPGEQIQESSNIDIVKEADRIAIEHYAPAGVVINNEMEIIQFRGNTGPYLEPAPGQASLNLLKMARHEFLPDLQAIIQQASNTRMPQRTKPLQIKYNGNSREVYLVAIPFNNMDIEEKFLLILFEETSIQLVQQSASSAAELSQKRSSKAVSPRISELKRELQNTKRFLQTTLEEQETINEELRSANEEIQSSNEELQSINEELETAKEELQSTNEELTTMNEELENRNEEYAQINGDLSNLLNSVQMPIIMLSNDLRIRRFTPLATKTFNIIPGDIGRKISDIKPAIEIPSLEKMMRKVITTLDTIRTEVKSGDGHWYYLVIRPYRTLENKIEGVVLMLVDIDNHKKQEEALEKEKQLARKMGLMEQEARLLSEAIVQTVREPLLVLNQEMRVIMANKAFFNTFDTLEKRTIGKHIFDLGNKQWNIPELRQLLEEIIPHNSFFEDFLVEHKFPKIGLRKMLLNARRIDSAESEKHFLLLAIEDMTKAE